MSQMEKIADLLDEAQERLALERVARVALRVRTNQRRETTYPWAETDLAETVDALPASLRERLLSEEGAEG